MHSFLQIHSNGHIKVFVSLKGKKCMKEEIIKMYPTKILSKKKTEREEQRSRFMKSYDLKTK